MRMDGPMIDEAIAEAEHGAVGNDTHAARWARPELKAFNSKEKAITFQVSFGRFPSFLRLERRLAIMIPYKISYTSYIRECRTADLLLCLYVTPWYTGCLRHSHC